MEQKVQILGLDTDTELRLMKPGMCRYILNCRVGTGATGNAGTVENVQGNVLVPYADLPSTGSNNVVGHYEDEAGHSVIYFIWNSSGQHQIAQYLADTNSIEKIFEWEGLNLSSNNYITGIGKVGDMLYWADGSNELRKINIVRAKAGEYAPVIAAGETNFLNVLIPPPALPLAIEREKDVTFTQNYIKDLSLQFCYRYRYVDNETTVLSPASILTPLSRTGVALEEEKNRVKLTIPADEVPGKLVKEIEFLYREGNTGKWRVFETKKRPVSGTFPTVYYFYNNRASFAIDDALAAKPHEGVPLSPGSLAIQDNRMFIGNYKESYPRPSVDLSAAPILAELENPSGFDLTGFTVYRIRVEGESCTEVTPGDWVCTPFDSIGGYVVGNGTDFYDGTFNAGFNAVVFNADVTPKTSGDYHYTSSATSPDPSFNTYSLVAGAGEDIFAQSGGASGLTMFQIFKSESAYQVGVLFKDYGGRNGGLADGAASVFMPALSSDIHNIIGHIEWELNTPTADAADEIPEWATHYHIVRTRNQSKLTFLQGMTADIAYSTQNGAATSRLYSYVYNASHACILIDISGLGMMGLGYIFTKGDRIKVFSVNGDDYDFEIRGQFGKYLEVPLTDIGTIDLGDFNFQHNYKFEIYTPYKTGETELYYEVGKSFAIDNAGTSSRDYSVRAGVLKGDCYLVNRRWASYTGSYDISTGAGDLSFSFGNEFYAEATSPNDKNYTTWDTDAGRATVRLVNGDQTYKPNGLRFSNKYIQGTQINGLSEFEALNETMLPIEDGAIRKLLSVGNSVMAFQEQSTTPLPINEAQISDTIGQTLISLSNQVIGKGRKLPYGTQHPESVVRNNDTVYWFDGKNRAVLRFDGDLKVISDIGMKTHFRGVNPNQTTGIIKAAHALFDPQSKEYIISNFGDDTGQTTFGFSEVDMLWKSGYSFWAKGCSIEQTVVMFNVFTAEVWVIRPYNASTTIFNSFYGANVLSVVNPVFNQDPDTVKIFQTLNVSADKVWACQVLLTQEGQFSELEEQDFETIEGQHQAEIMRDLNTPNVDYPLFEGDEMRSTALETRLVNDSTEHTKLFSVTVGYAKS